jgi:glycosyltransferase involved in cell wall biosynthesis
VPPEKPRRVAIDVTPLQTGHAYRGIGSYVYGLLSGLLATDSENEYFLFAYDDSPCEALDSVRGSFHIVSLPRPRVGRASALLTHQVILPYELGRHDLDVFHCPGITPSPSVPGIPLWGGPRTLVTVHDLTPLVYNDVFLRRPASRLLYHMALRAVRRSAHIVCDAESTKRDLVRLLHIEARCVSVIPLAPDATFLSESPYADDTNSLLSPEMPFVLHVGGGHYNKNTDTLIRAYARLCHQDGIKESLVLVGEGYDPASVLHSDREVLSRILVLHGLPRPSLARLYRRATVFVYPSLHEGFGLPPLEAMASGVPVIVSNTSSLPEVVGDAAILVDPHDERELARAIQLCLRDPALRAQMRQRGTNWVRSFSWCKAAQATAALYALVADGVG